MAKCTSIVNLNIDTLFVDTATLMNFSIDRYLAKIFFLNF